jgi:recombination protein RecA
MKFDIFHEGDLMEILNVEAEAQIQRWSTGFEFLDALCGGGLPRGLTEMFGNESSCKSALLNHIMGHCLSVGGASQLYDQEDAFEVPRFQNLTGLTLEKFIDRDSKNRITSDSKFIPARADTLEEMLADVETQSAHWREHILTPEAPILFGLDSLASTESKAEAERGYDKQEMASIPAALSRNLKKTISAAHRANFMLLVINQTREKVNVMFGDKTSTPGGKAIKFYAMMRIKMQNIKTRPDGLDIQLTTVKNKIDRPKRTLVMPFNYETGFSDIETAKYLLKAYGYLKQSAKKIQIKTNKGWIEMPKDTDDPRLIKLALKLYHANHRLVRNAGDD